MKKILKSTLKTKKYLEFLPKVYGLFLWGSWGILELPWTGRYTKEGLPLVYIYYDGNGICDEYHLLPIRSASSGCFWGWYKDRNKAKEAQEKLNNALSRRRN